MMYKMTSSLSTVFGITCLVLGIAAKSAAESEPRNTVAVLGSDVQFRLTHPNCNWLRIGYDGKTMEIYSESAGRLTEDPHLSVNHASTQCDLNLKNVTYAYGGLYRYGNGEGHGVLLIVTDAAPTCSVAGVNKNVGVLEGDKLELQCSISMSTDQFTPELSMSWLPNTNAQEVFSRPEREQNAERVTLSSKYSVNISSSDANFARCSVRLNGYPSAYRNEDRVDQKMLNYNSYCTTAELQILRPAHNARVLNSTSGTMKPGDKIVCNAAGSPPLRYQWLKEGEVVAQSEVLVLDSPPGLHTYTCLAYNTIHGINRTSEAEVKLFMADLSVNANKFLAILSLVIGLFCLLSLTVMIVICIFYVNVFNRKFPSFLSKCRSQQNDNEANLTAQKNKTIDNGEELKGIEMQTCSAKKFDQAKKEEHENITPQTCSAKKVDQAKEEEHENITPQTCSAKKIEQAKIDRETMHGETSQQYSAEVSKLNPCSEVPTSIIPAQQSKEISSEIRPGIAAENLDFSSLSLPGVKPRKTAVKGTSIMLSQQSKQISSKIPPGTAAENLDFSSLSLPGVKPRHSDDEGTTEPNRRKKPDSPKESKGAKQGNGQRTDAEETADQYSARLSSPPDRVSNLQESAAGQYVACSSANTEKLSEEEEQIDEVTSMEKPAEEGNQVDEGNLQASRANDRRINAHGSTVSLRKREEGTEDERKSLIV